MAGRDRGGWPWWVRLGLWGLPSRAAAMVFFWLAFVLAMAGVVAGLREPRMFFGAIFFLAAAWYWAAVRWVDRNGRWD